MIEKNIKSVALFQTFRLLSYNLMIMIMNSPLYNLIINMRPWILLSQILINFSPGNSQGSFHITPIIISILNLTSNINHIILISRITISVIITTVLDCLPYLRFGCRLISCSDVLQWLEASHVGEIML